jgi:hypothetical protein
MYMVVSDPDHDPTTLQSFYLHIKSKHICDSSDITDEVPWRYETWPGQDWLGWDIEDTGDGDLHNVPQCIAPARHIGRWDGIQCKQ